LSESVSDILVAIDELAETPADFWSESAFQRYLLTVGAIDNPPESLSESVRPIMASRHDTDKKDVEIEVVDSLPFELDSTKLEVRAVPVEGTMTPEQSKDCWRQIFSAAKVESDEARQVFAVDVMTWFIVNSGSSRANFTGDFTHASYGTVPVRVLKTVLDTQVRRFCRANANFAHKILRANQELARKQRGVLGLSEAALFYAFDFADACHPVSEDVLAELKSMRGYKVTSASAYTSESRLAAANYKPAAASLTSAQRAFPGGGGMGQYPVD